MKNVDITSKVEYIKEKSDPSIPLFLFSYNIEIINKTNTEIKLLNRLWEITDGNGCINTVNGKGVVGVQPIILHGKTFKYRSFCPLPTEFGMMNGWYEMKDANNNLFKINIPTLSLFTPSSKN